MMGFEVRDVVARGMGRILCGVAIAGVAMVCGATRLVAQAPSSKLPEILARLDTKSAEFKSAQASFHKVLVNAFLKDKTEQDGSMYVEGKGDHTQVGLKITGEGARTLDYKGGLLRVFNPALGCFDAVTAKNGQAESFLALGFGGSGKELASAWEITDKGTDTLTSDGKPVKVEKLDLVPKEQNVKNTVTHVTLWIDLVRGVAVQQELFSPSGDTQTAVYSNIRLNAGAVDKKPFEFANKPCGKKPAAF
jgi:outer membrane lipoprotein-sorting protein